MINKRIFIVTLLFALFLCSNVFANTGTVRITFFDEENNKEFDYYTKRDLVVGEEYIFEVDRFLSDSDYDYDYTFNYSTPSHNSGLIHIDIKEATTYYINLYYDRDNVRQRSLTVTYYNSDTNKSFDSFTVNNLYEDELYTHTIRNISGYTFDYSSPSAVNNKITKTISYYNNKNTINVYYKPNSSSNYDHHGYDFNRNHASQTDTYYTGSKLLASSDYIQLKENGLSIKSGTYGFAQGYSDGTFRPDSNITRGEAINMFYLILNNQYTNENKSFSDISTSSPYYGSTSYFLSKKIIGGYEDGSFRPNSYINREEFITIATKIYGFPSLSDGKYFNDVSSSRWSYPYINAGKSLGFLDGYNSGSFTPTKYVTRAEATKIISSMIGANVSPISTNKYSDLPENHWAYSYIINCGL